MCFSRIDLNVSPTNCGLPRDGQSGKKRTRTAHVAASLTKDYQYSGNETCATDGLCATACPVKIDTGKLIKSLRTEEIWNAYMQLGAKKIAKKIKLSEDIRYGYSTSRTCEIGLSLHSVISHQSIVYLVDEVSKARSVNK